MQEKEKKLITLIVLVYNQAEYVSEALINALHQTYSPLQIVVADDCSTDGSYEIIEDISKEYNGPHELVIYRNDTNLGLIKNFNKAISLSNGELIVASAGDDISLPNRVETLYQNWVTDNNSIMAIVSSSFTIDSEGNEILPSLYENKENRLETDYYNKCPFHGACAAYSSKIFKTFGSIEEQKCYEDMVCYRRSLLLGKVLFLKDKLVKYRLGGISTKEKSEIKSYSEYKKSIISGLERDSSFIKQLLIDINKLENKNSIIKSLEYLNNIFDKRIKFYNSNNIFVRIYLLISLFSAIFIRPKEYLDNYKFGSHHWKIMFMDLLPNRLNNYFFHFDYLARKIYRK